MDGLLLGLIGGTIAGLSLIVGALFILLKDDYNKEFAFQLRLDFFMGVLLIITAFSLLHPTNENSINLNILAFFLGILFLLLSKIIVKNILETIATQDPNDPKEKKAISFILIAVLKNIPVGFAAGSLMTLSHSGESNSLLTAVAFYNLFVGAAVALAFLSLGLDELMSIIGVMAVSVLTIFTGLFGSYLGQESSALMPVIMAFTGGVIMSTTIQDFYQVAKKECKNFIHSPSFISAAMVMLIFIVWKELL